VPTIATTYPKPGGGTGTGLIIVRSHYSNMFLDNELTRWEARAMTAQQRPLSLDAVTETSGTPAWNTRRPGAPPLRPRDGRLIGRGRAELLSPAW
jgi:hypothetical protein